MTKKEDRVVGKFSGHYQVMIVVEGVETPLILGLKGYTKTTCWDNNPNGQYGQSDFPAGVWQRLSEYTRRASKQQKTKIPVFCSWAIDLVPVYMKDKPHFVDVGHGTFMNPFNVDLRTSPKKDDGLPKTRFVGMPNFLKYQDMRRSIALPWEQEWDDPSNLVQSHESNGSYDEQEEIEEDDIP